jgi:hypothetical protein
MLFKLDHSHAEHLQINSLGRIVRTRLYFTSESHIHTILNVLRYSTTSCSVGIDAMEQLEKITDVSYLSQIVIRLFENRYEPGKFSCELSFSPGSTFLSSIIAAPTITTTDEVNNNNNNNNNNNKSSSSSSSTTTANNNNNNNNSNQNQNQIDFLAPYVYLNHSVDLDEVLKCLDDAIDVYHSTDHHHSANVTVSANTVNESLPRESDTIEQQVEETEGLSTEVVTSDIQREEETAPSIIGGEDGGSHSGGKVKRHTLSSSSSSLSSSSPMKIESIKENDTHVIADSKSSLLDIDSEPLHEPSTSSITSANNNNNNTTTTTGHIALSLTTHFRTLSQPELSSMENLSFTTKKFDENLILKNHHQRPKSFHVSTSTSSTTSTPNKLSILDPSSPAISPMKRVGSNTVNMEDASDRWEYLETTIPRKDILKRDQPYQRRYQMLMQQQQLQNNIRNNNNINCNNTINTNNNNNNNKNNNSRLTNLSVLPSSSLPPTTTISTNTISITTQVIADSSSTSSFIPPPPPTTTTTVNATSVYHSSSSNNNNNSYK